MSLASPVSRWMELTLGFENAVAFFGVLNASFLSGFPLASQRYIPQEPQSPTFP